MKPIYSPSNKIVRQYTYGREYVLFSTKQEYKGPYHIFPNGSVYTGTVPSKQSELLEVYTNVYNDPNTSTYARITGKQFNNHTAPRYFYPRPTNDNYRAGYIERYLVQKINEPDVIYEISDADFRKINKENKQGINGALFRALRIKWLIVGAKNDIHNTNSRVVAYHERTIPGLSNYLSNFTEFSK